jgi:hypothetical protein
LHVIELEKPANKWCKHCRPGYGGCTIHDTRPDICRGYFCGWMLSKNVSDDWYPLRSHMILSLSKINGIQTVTVTVDPKHAWIWKTSPYYEQIRRMAWRGLHVKTADDILLVHVRVKGQVFLITPNEDVEISKCFYLLKLVAPGEWAIEQYPTQELAEQRIGELTMTTQQ